MNSFNKAKFDKAPKPAKPGMPTMGKGKKVMRKDAKKPVEMFKKGGKC